MMKLSSGPLYARTEVECLDWSRCRFQQKGGHSFVSSDGGFGIDCAKVVEGNLKV